MNRLKPGLVSVTFRPLTPRDIVSLVVEAGLEAIEWGGDLHVPHGDLTMAREVGAMTRDAGLEVAAYGSYYRAASIDGPHFEAVLSTASALKAPTIRVWAGQKGSADADAAYREAVAADLRRIASLAQAEKITISLEFHGGTLTDRKDSTLALLQEVGHPNLFSYWQPDVMRPSIERAEALQALLPYLTSVHVFQWEHADGQTIRHSLAEGEIEWREYLTILAGTKSRFVLLEFVRGDSPEQFLADARTLRAWVGPA